MSYADRYYAYWDESARLFKSGDVGFRNQLTIFYLRWELGRDPTTEEVLNMARTDFHKSNNQAQAAITISTRLVAAYGITLEECILIAPFGKSMMAFFDNAHATTSGMD